MSWTGPSPVWARSASPASRRRRAPCTERPLDRTDPEGAIAAAAERCSNWGRWGDDDVLGTLNFLDDGQAPRGRGAGPARRGFSLAQSFDTDGPQKGWRRRTNPVHTMLDTGLDAERGNQGFPHGLGGADDVIAMPLQASTQWDGLGHIFDHGMAWNGRRAGDVVTSEGDLVTGIETVGGRMRRPRRPARRRPGDRRRRANCPTVSPSPPSTSTRPSPRRAVGPGRPRRHRSWSAPGGWPAPAGRAGATTPAAPRPGCRSPPPDWLHGTEIAAIATDTWGFEVRPNEFDVAFQPLHQVAIPNMGLFIGEMWDLDALAADCAADGRYEFFLTAAPLPGHRRRRRPGQPDRRQVDLLRLQGQGRADDDASSEQCSGRRGGPAGNGDRDPARRAGVAVDLVEVKPDATALGSGITLQGNALRVLRQLGVWDEVRRAGYAVRLAGPAAPPTARCWPRSPTPAPAGPTSRPPSACRARTWPASWWTRARPSGSSSASAPPTPP